jgi:hypothetical protein
VQRLTGCAIPRCSNVLIPNDRNLAPNNQSDRAIDTQESGHWRSSPSKRFKPCEDRCVRAPQRKSDRAVIDRPRPLDGLPLHLEINGRVPIRCGHTSVTKPLTDGDDVDARSEEVAQTRLLRHVEERSLARSGLNHQQRRSLRGVSAHHVRVTFTQDRPLHSRQTAYGHRDCYLPRPARHPRIIRAGYRVVSSWHSTRPI